VNTIKHAIAQVVQIK